MATFYIVVQFEYAADGSRLNSFELADYDNMAAAAAMVAKCYADQEKYGLAPDGSYGHWEVQVERR